MARSDCFVSVVAPLHNDGAIVSSFVNEVMGVLESNYTNFELVLVDDGSQDETVSVVRPLLGKYKCIRLQRLSRRFGTEIAIASGLDGVIGDYVVILMPSTDPPALIPEFVRECRSGGGVVYGVVRRPAGEGTLWKVGRRFFHWVCRRFLNLSLPEGATHFRVLSRQAVNALTEIRDKYRYLHLLSLQVGYDPRGLSYEHVNRGGRVPRRRFGEAINWALGIIITNSTHPLRVVTWLGLFASVLNLLYVGYILAVYLIKQNVAEGWTTLSLQSAGMFFFVFLILTVLSEYIGRILDESKHRPLYYVKEELNSSVLVADSERRNIVTDSPLEGAQLSSPVSHADAKPH